MKWLKRVFLLLLIIYGLAVLLLYFSQESLLFPTTRLDPEFQFQLQHEFEEINLPAEDGASLNAIYHKQDSSKGIILYFHGNGGNLQRWNEIIAPFLQYNYEVLIMDYRGYGKSNGERSTEAMYSDAELFYEYVLKKYPEEEIIVYGRSLGCTFATWVSSVNHPQHLILEAPFYNLSSIVKTYYWFLPSSILMKYEFNTNEFIQKVESPITFIHGTDDLVVPYTNGNRLFQLTENANQITIDGGKHNDLAEYKGYWEAINNILQ